MKPYFLYLLSLLLLAELHAQSDTLKGKYNILSIDTARILYPHYWLIAAKDGIRYKIFINAQKPCHIKGERVREDSGYELILRPSLIPYQLGDSDFLWGDFRGIDYVVTGQKRENGTYEVTETKTILEPGEEAYESDCCCIEGQKVYIEEGKR